MGRKPKPLTPKRWYGHDLLDAWAERNPDVIWSNMARAFDVSTAFIYYLRAGQGRPGMDVAAMLEDYTQGAVPMRAWTQRSVADAPQPGTTLPVLEALDF